jgi:hypothetical protein
MPKGIATRLDIAGSREGFGVGMMTGQPFPLSDSARNYSCN